MDKQLIKGTHHISLKAKGSAEFDKTVDFYKNVLGMPVIRSWGTESTQGIMLHTGNSIMEISASGIGEKGRGSIQHFALATDDTDACIQRVRDAGYDVILEPISVEIPSVPVFPIRVAFCTGPLGEEIEFFCER